MGRSWPSASGSEGVTRDKIYELGKGTPGTRVFYFAVHDCEEESAENTVLVHLKPALRLRNVSRLFQFGEITVKGRAAKGKHHHEARRRSRREGPQGIGPGDGDSEMAVNVFRNT